MRRIGKLSLRSGRKPKDEKQNVGFRCPPELLVYIDHEAKKPGRDKTEVIISALELDRDLDQQLNKYVKRLKAFAEANSLDLNENLAEVLAMLVRERLDELGVTEKSKE